MNIILDVLGHLLFVGMLFIPFVYVSAKEHGTSLREELFGDEDE